MKEFVTRTRAQSAIYIIQFSDIEPRKRLRRSRKCFNDMRMRNSFRFSHAALQALCFMAFSLCFSVAQAAEIRTHGTQDQLHLVGVLHSSDSSESRVIVEIGDDSGGVFSTGEELTQGIRVEAIETDRMRLRAGEREWTVMLDGRPPRANDRQLAQEHADFEPPDAHIAQENVPVGGSAYRSAAVDPGSSSAMRRMQALRSSPPVRQVIDQSPVAPPRAHRSVQRFTAIRP